MAAFVHQRRATPHRVAREESAQGLPRQALPVHHRVAPVLGLADGVAKVGDDTDAVTGLNNAVGSQLLPRGEQGQARRGKLRVDVQDSLPGGPVSRGDGVEGLAAFVRVNVPLAGQADSVLHAAGVVLDAHLSNVEEVEALGRPPTVSVCQAALILHLAIAVGQAGALNCVVTADGDGQAWDDVRRLKKMRVECKELLPRQHKPASDRRQRVPLQHQVATGPRLKPPVVGVKRRGLHLLNELALKVDVVIFFCDDLRYLRWLRSWRPCCSQRQSQENAFSTEIRAGCCATSAFFDLNIILSKNDSLPEKCVHNQVNISCSFVCSKRELEIEVARPWWVVEGASQGLTGQGGGGGPRLIRCHHPP
mmetsp:Transcript_331/g.725  ORF Transcript_331/g.725 Transcript_331/m.725 type:complete len:364 (+) Transcript_331:330-1421(+)